MVLPMILRPQYIVSAQHDGLSSAHISGALWFFLYSLILKNRKLFQKLYYMHSYFYTKCVLISKNIGKGSLYLKDWTKFYKKNVCIEKRVAILHIKLRVKWTNIRLLHCIQYNFLTNSFTNFSICFVVYLKRNFTQA